MTAKRDFESASGATEGDADGARGHWTECEIDETAFKDARLGRRFGEVIRQIGDGMGESIPYACQDWASTKAAYRFFANDRVEEAEILSGHFAATRARFAASSGPVLLIQDTRASIAGAINGVDYAITRCAACLCIRASPSRPMVFHSVSPR